MANELSLFGGNGDSGALAPMFSPAMSRKVQRDVEQVQAQQQVALARVAASLHIQQAELAAKAALRAAEEHAHHFIASATLSNTAAMVAQTKSHAKTVPEGAGLYEAVATSYAQAAIQRMSKGL